MNWKTIETAPDNQVVMTKIDDEDGVRNECPLRRCGNLFYFTDDSMYVYYRPTHWREMTPEEKAANHARNRNAWLAKEPKP